MFWFLISCCGSGSEKANRDEVLDRRMTAGGSGGERRGGKVFGWAMAVAVNTSTLKPARITIDNHDPT